MRRRFAWGGILVCALGQAALAADALLYVGVRPPVNVLPEPFYAPNRIVVVFDARAAQHIGETPEQMIASSAFVGIDSLDDIALAHGVISITKQFPGADALTAAEQGLPDLSGYYIVEFDDTMSALDDVLAAYDNDPNVLFTEPIGIHPVWATPNDGNYSSQWHLNQASDRDMDAPEAWDIETGDPSVIAAVLDTGVRYYHKDLGGSNASSTNPTAADGNMWINLAEKNGTTGVDDDGNGRVDDWIGYDFVSGVSGCWSGEDCSTADNDPRDFNGHGTHCAGNVTAINNNGYATASPAGGWGNGTLQPTANGVKMMALRIGWSGSWFGQEVGFVDMSFAASALYYAAGEGCKIASCSWGSSNSGGIAAAIDNFNANGGLIFKAAGNDGGQTADYMCGRSDVYCVAATDQSDQKASFSTYGTWVDISAPGVQIMSLYHVHSDPANDYVAAIDGTSMATPLTAGVAAAVWSRNPTWTASQVWGQVRDTADNIDALNPSYVGKLGSGRVNLYNAVNTGGGGCQNNSECDDGNACNGAEVCVGGSCQAGSITDCNGNGNDDSCDISGGGSEDCNSNGIPDECEGGGGTQSFSASPNLAIPDGNTNGVSNTINVGTSGTITEVSVTVNITHTWNGDLTVQLTHGATTIDLIQRPGHPTLTWGYDNDGFSNVTLDDDNATSIETYDSGGGAVSGNFSPSPGQLSAFDGMDMSGAWTMKVFDSATPDAGTFQNWTLNITTSGDPCAGCDTNGDCDDGNACNGAEVCVGGSCQSGSITDCNSNGNDDSCDISGGGSEDCNSNGIPDECEGGDPCGGGGQSLLLSFTGSTSVPDGVGTVQNEDIVAFDLATGTYSLYFDGSDVGLSSHTVDGLAVLPTGELLISVATDGTIAGLQGGPSGDSVDDADIVMFTPTSLGPVTSGTWTFYFDGSDVGLTTSGEDIDAIGIDPLGRIIVSCVGNPGVSGLSSLADEDLIAFSATSLGSVTAGTWSYYFDGSDVGLSTSSSEDSDACFVDADENILLSTVGSFSVTGASGNDEDVFEFVPTSLGSATSGSFSMYFDASVEGLPTSSDVNAVEIVNNP